MCWTYEDKYERCFDYLFFDGEDSLIFLLDEYGVEIVDRDKFQSEFLKLLDKLHEDGTIRPRAIPISGE